MSYAENALPATLQQASQPSDFLKELGLTPQQNANLIEFLRTGDTGKTANSVLISRYLQAFNEGRTGESLAEAAGQSGAQVQGAALGAAGVRQDADVNAALSGQRTGELAEGVGDVTGSLDGLIPAERKMIDDLTKQGKNVETIPRSNVPGGKTPDFNVNNVKTELKTMQNPNTNTGMKRIQEGFGQGAETVIIDARGSGLTRTQASEIINRAKGKYLNGLLPGKVEIWIDGQIITYP